MVSINQPNDYVSNIRQSFAVKMGTVTVAALTPTLQTTTEELRNLPISKRKCRFEDEMPEKMGGSAASLFRKYTQKSCQFMCLLRNATVFGKQLEREHVFSHEKCVPWDLPNLLDIPVCMAKDAATRYAIDSK